MIQDFRLMIR